MKIIETPRDGMQGLHKYIPVNHKIDYLNTLLKVGFDVVDIGSFVSAKAIPQLRDTAEVIENLDISESHSKIMVLVANEKGGGRAVQFEKIDYLSFPFSVSPTFLKRNINSDIEKSLVTIDELVNKCQKSKKELVVYISMAFGNPYGDEWNLEILEQYVEILHAKGIRKIPLADVLGNSTNEKVRNVFSMLIPKFPEVEFGFHLHTKPNNWLEKVDSAYKAGCRNYEAVIGGIGGCPMAADKLLANLNTRNLLQYCSKNRISNTVNMEAFNLAEKNLFEMTK
jgi:hydroxymethylglutaryl-CoA lyase